MATLRIALLRQFFACLLISFTLCIAIKYSTVTRESLKSIIDCLILHKMF